MYRLSSKEILLLFAQLGNIYNLHCNTILKDKIYKCVLGGRGGNLSVTCGTPLDSVATQTILTTTTSSTLESKSTLHSNIRKYLRFFNLRYSEDYRIKKRVFGFFLNDSIYQLTKKTFVNFQPIYFLK